MKHHTTVKDLVDRLQFVLLLVFFLPVVLLALRGSNPGGFDADKITLEYGVVVAALLINYFLLELSKVKLRAWVARWTDFFFLFQIAMYVPMYYLLALWQVHPNAASTLTSLVFGVSIVAPILFPVIVCALLLTNVVLNWAEME